jgi:AcrR family transcriptional regulator
VTNPPTSTTIPDGQQVNKLDRRWVRTHERFIRVGFDLFGKHGLDGVGVDGIVARAGVSKQTFYNHFPDRDALIRVLRVRSSQIFERAVTIANDGVEDPARRLVRGVAVYARMALDEPLHAHFMLRTLTLGLKEDRVLARGLAQDLSNCLEGGRLQFSTLAAAVTFVAGVGQALVTRMVNDQDTARAVSLTRELLTLLLRAFCCDPVEAELIAAETAEDIVGRPIMDLPGAAVT